MCPVFLTKQAEEMGADVVAELGEVELRFGEDGQVEPVAGVGGAVLFGLAVAHEPLSRVAIHSLVGTLSARASRRTVMAGILSGLASERDIPEMTG